MPPPAEGFASRLFLGPALRTQPDRRLVMLVREGYETAFDEIVRRYGKPLTRYAASIVGSRSEDVAQDAFSKALLALRRDNAEIELRPWLFRIVRNTALNDLRDSPPSAEVLAEAIAGGRNPAEELERREELADLMKRLQALPEPQRAAIVMRELEGLSHDEIAAALGLTGGGARQTIYRARQALRDGLGMLIPLPLLQAMLSGPGPGAAEAAVGVAGAGSAAGAGVALKATAATVLVAGAVGAGVALENSPRNDAKATPVQASPVRPAGTAPLPATAVPSASQSNEGQGGGPGGGDHGGRGSESGDDRGDRGPHDQGHGGQGPSDDRSGSGHRGSGSGHDSDDFGGSGSGSHHDGGSGSGQGSGSSSGPGSGSGGDDGGSGSSGSGGGSGPSDDHSGDAAPIPPAQQLDDDGSDVSGSGSDSGSGSVGGGEPTPGDDHSGQSG